MPADVINIMKNPKSTNQNTQEINQEQKQMEAQKILLNGILDAAYLYGEGMSLLTVIGAFDLAKSIVKDNEREES